MALLRFRSINGAFTIQKYAVPVYLDFAFFGIYKYIVAHDLLLYRHVPHDDFVYPFIKPVCQLIVYRWGVFLQI